MMRRLFLLRVVIFVFAAAVIVRLFWLQVLDHAFYKALAENQHQLFQTLIPNRGEIFVSGGRDSAKMLRIVSNIEKDQVYAVPGEIPDKQKTSAVLASILGMARADILQKISDPEKKWVSVKKELSESESLAVSEGKLPGIYLQGETYRFYPEGTLAAQVLGFLGYDNDKRVGQYGIEGYFEDKLAGEPGTLSLEKDAKGQWISGAFRKVQPAQDGDSIVLTLDQAIQFQVESILKKEVDTHQAESGSAVVMNPKTGAVLAMANYPTFDPNAFSKVTDQKVFMNNVVSESFEPGSVFKAITMAGAIDAGAVTPDETYNDTGEAAIDKYVIKNSDQQAHGVQTMTQVLEKSLNTGAIYVQDKLGPEKFLDTIKKFGFGKTTGITLPAEAAGNYSNLIGGGDIHYATASFGQGITVTLLQLVQAFGAIANQGKMMKPYIVDSIIYPNGSVEKTRIQDAGQVISSKSANTIGAMLVSVVENGHGKKAGVPGYYVAGKTGTAQVANPSGGGYDPNNTIGSFAGFAPVDDPAFVAVVSIRNPSGVKFAESTAAPAFGELARFLLNYYQIPTTR